MDLVHESMLWFVLNLNVIYVRFLSQRLKHPVLRSQDLYIFVDFYTGITLYYVTADSKHIRQIIVKVNK